MFTVYVLISLKSRKRYVGLTEKPVAQRVLEHNRGSNKWTRGHRPFKVVYTEIYYCKLKAIRRERFLKTGKGREFLDNLFK